MTLKLSLLNHFSSENPILDLFLFSLSLSFNLRKSKALISPYDCEKKTLLKLKLHVLVFLILCQNKKRIFTDRYFNETVVQGQHHATGLVDKTIYTHVYISMEVREHCMIYTQTED